MYKTLSCYHYTNNIAYQLWNFQSSPSLSGHLVLEHMHTNTHTQPHTYIRTHAHYKKAAFMVWEALIIWVEMSLSSLMTVTAKPFISIYPGYCVKMTPSMQFLLIALFNVKERAQPWRRELSPCLWYIENVRDACMWGNVIKNTATDLSLSRSWLSQRPV